MAYELFWCFLSTNLLSMSSEHEHFHSLKHRCFLDVCFFFLHVFYSNVCVCVRVCVCDKFEMRENVLFLLCACGLRSLGAEAGAML